MLIRDYTQYKNLSDEEIETRVNDIVQRRGEAEVIKYAHLIGLIKNKETAKAISK